MVPLPPVADHLGPIALCPPDRKIAALFGGIGTVTEIDTEEQLHALWTVTAMMAPYFGFLQQMSAWLEARKHSAATSAALCRIDAPRPFGHWQNRSATAVSRS